MRESLPNGYRFAHHCKTTAEACKNKTQPTDATKALTTRTGYGPLTLQLSIEPKIRLRKGRSETYNRNAGGSTLSGFSATPEELPAVIVRRLEDMYDYCRAQGRHRRTESQCRWQRRSLHCHALPSDTLGATDLILYARNGTSALSIPPKPARQTRSTVAPGPTLLQKYTRPESARGPTKAAAVTDHLQRAFSLSRCTRNASSFLIAVSFSLRRACSEFRYLSCAASSSRVRRSRMSSLAVASSES